MKFIVFFIVSLLFNSGMSIAKETTQASPKTNQITFNISTSSYTPYMIHDLPPRGIMIDTMNEIGRRIGKKIVFKKIPRKRVEEQIVSGELDTSGNAIEWLKNKENFNWTDEVVPQKDVIFVRKDFKNSVDTPQDLFGLTIGAHIGYSFKVLDPFFEDKSIKRHNVGSEEQLIKMLQTKRLDAIVGNEIVIKHTMKEQNVNSDDYKIGNLKIGQFAYRYIFKKKNEALRNIVNTELNKLKEEGFVDKVVNSYMNK